MQENPSKQVMEPAEIEPIVDADPNTCAPALGIVEREIYNIALAQSQEHDPEREKILYVMRQVLSWAIDPNSSKAPMLWFRDTHAS